jgi:hypothetical protein
MFISFLSCGENGNCVTICWMTILNTMAKLAMERACS